MPLYVYKCFECNQEFDEVLSIECRNDPCEKPCPHCGEVKAIGRVYTTGGFADPGILNADKNMEKSGVLKELNRLKEHHPQMKWKG